MPSLVRNSTVLIGLCGKMHSGKSTVADTLSQERDYHVRYFAGPVKYISARMTNTMWSEVGRNLGLKWDDLSAADLDADKNRFRPLFQFVGSYGRHVFGDDVWIKVFEGLYAKDGKFHGPMAVADVRYPNEAKYLLNNGFDVYLIRRDEKQRIASVKAGFEASQGRKPKKKELKAILGHESETGVDDIQALGLFTDIITNEAGVHELQTVARSLA